MRFRRRFFCMLLLDSEVGSNLSCLDLQLGLDVHGSSPPPCLFSSTSQSSPWLLIIKRIHRNELTLPLTRIVISKCVMSSSSPIFWDYNRQELDYSTYPCIVILNRVHFLVKLTRQIFNPESNAYARTVSRYHAVDQRVAYVPAQNKEQRQLRPRR